MTQQTFSLYKETGSDIIESKSVFNGFRFHERVAIQPNTQFEFLIYHGSDGMSFSFSIAATPAPLFLGDLRNDEARMARRIQPGARPADIRNALFTTAAGNIVSDGIAQPGSTRISGRVIPFVNNDIWHGDDWGPGEFYDDGYPDDTGGGFDNPNPGGGGGGGGYAQAPIDVALYRPGENEPVHTWYFDYEEHSDLYRAPIAFPVVQEGDVVVLPNPELMKKRGWWKCVVTILGEDPVLIGFLSTSTVRKIQWKEKRFKNRWLNHSFWNVLNILAPQVSIDGNWINIGVAKEVSDVLGREPVTFTKKVDEINSHAQLTAIQITATRGKEVHLFLKDRKNLALQELDREKVKVIPGENSTARYARIAPYQDRYDKALARYNASLSDFNTDDAVIRFIPVFSDPSIAVSAYGLGGEIEFDSMPSLFFGFGKTRLNDFTVYAEVGCKVKGVNLLESILVNIFTDYPTSSSGVQALLNSIIESGVSSQAATITKYLYMALGKAAGQTAVIDELRATADEWIVSYYDLPAHPDPSRQVIDFPDVGGVPEGPISTEISSPTAMPAGVVAPGGAGISAPETPTVATNTSTPVSPSIFNEADIPEAFEMGSLASRRKLDKVETIV